MKVLLVNGSPHKEGCTFTALSEIAKTLKEEGIESEIYWIGKKAIAGCIGCRKCFEKGKCVFDDGVNEIGARIDEFDGFVFGAPVYYSGPDGQLCAFMDRLFYSNAPKFKGKIGAAIVNARRSGTTASFERLNQYFLITNMVVPGSIYWNATHGFTPDDVRKDLEGLQTMRTLAKNIAWLIKSIDAGKKAGVAPPEYEERIFTNFI